MPLSREEFRLGRIDLTIPVRQILENRPDLSFNAGEIRELLAQTLARISFQEEVVSALEQLESGGYAESKVILGDRWYTIVVDGNRGRIGFRQGG